MSPGACVLVIDDEQAVREFIRQALPEYGYEVEVADGGVEGLEKLSSGRFDMVLCDLMMPDLDGLATIERIRAVHPDLPVIVITAHGTIEGAIESLRKGVFDFLQKPLIMEEVAFSIGRALERRDLVERVGLFELSRSIFETLDSEDLYGRIARSAMQVLGADDISLMLLDENRELVIALSTSLGEDIREETRLAMGERIAGRVALQTEPIVINEDVGSDARFAGVQSFRQFHASIVCPLTMRGELLGVLNISRVGLPGRYTERDRRNAMILGSLVALALGNARLHKEIETRLQQLHETQEEVIQKEKMTALGGMLSGVAHELNNPLCSVLGYAQLLRQAEVEPRTRKGIEVILREAERASRIVANLLRFARRERPEKRPIGLNGILLKTLERKAADLKICRIRVKAELDSQLPQVLGDFHQLTTTFTNLITNAQQAMFEHRGEGQLTVRSFVRDGLATVALTDDGPGIAPEHVRRVFDPFFTTKAVGMGTGLGLSVAFAIVRDHGGMIRILPGNPAGVTFTMEIPIPSQEALRAAGKPAEDGEGPEAAAADTGRRPRTPPRSKRGPAPKRPPLPVPEPPEDSAGPRVLVAEQEPRVAGLLVDVLGSMGFRADTAPDRQAVLERLRSGDYQALIADFALPNMDGHRLLETLRDRNPALARRVVFLAEDAADPRLMAFAATSGNMLIGRPFDPDTLRSALRRLLTSTLIDDTPVH